MSFPYSPLAVVGTVAVDAVETPHGKRDKVFGGSASYFSYVASLFTKVALVAVVGEDFPQAYRKILQERPIDLSHLQTLKGKTFSWSGKYVDDMNSAQTLSTDLNTLLLFNPELKFKKQPEYLFLANIDPDLQLKVLHQMDRKKLKFVAADTMNFWISSKRDQLLKVLSKVDAIVLNDGETKMLTGEKNLLAAAKQIIKMGPRWVIVKKGEHGSMLLGKNELFTLPAYPVEKVFDPTGAGDTFAGGFMGYLAWTKKTDFATIKQALAMGTVTASVTVQDFGLDAVRKINRSHLTKKFKHLQSICKF